MEARQAVPDWLETCSAVEHGVGVAGLRAGMAVAGAGHAVSSKCRVLERRHDAYRLWSEHAAIWLPMHKMASTVLTTGVSKKHCASSHTQALVDAENWFRVTVQGVSERMIFFFNSL